MARDLAERAASFDNADLDDFNDSIRYLAECSGSDEDLIAALASE
jgi:hypothetical protein